MSHAQLKAFHAVAQSGGFSRAAERLSLTQPAVSRHLRILRESRLVDVRPDGARRVYSLRPAALSELDRWLDTYRRFWAARLDDLEAHLDARASRDQPVQSGESNHSEPAP